MQFSLSRTQSLAKLTIMQIYSMLNCLFSNSNVNGGTDIADIDVATKKNDFD